MVCHATYASHSNGLGHLPYRVGIVVTYHAEASEDIFGVEGGGREAVRECLTIPPNNQNLARKWDDESEVCLVRNRQMSMRAT